MLKHNCWSKECIVHPGTVRGAKVADGLEAVNLENPQQVFLRHCDRDINTIYVKYAVSEFDGHLLYLFIFWGRKQHSE